MLRARINTRSLEMASSGGLAAAPARPRIAARATQSAPRSADLMRLEDYRLAHRDYLQSYAAKLGVECREVGEEHVLESLRLSLQLGLQIVEDRVCIGDRPRVRS